LKNTASPFAQRHLNLVLGEEVDELGPVEGDVAAEELLRVGQQHRRPALDRHVAMSHCALQSQRRRRAVQVRRICRKVVGCDEAEMVVPMRNLLVATGIDDVNLRCHLVARTEPGLRHDVERVIGVVLGEDGGRVHGEFLRGIPDTVVGPRLAEVVTGRRTVGALRVDDGGECLAGAVDDAVGERVLEHHHAGPVRQRPDQLGLKRATF
jgi:hypothetical protein